MTDDLLRHSAFDTRREIRADIGAVFEPRLLPVRERLCLSSMVVGNLGEQSVSIFDAGASGNTAPARLIVGSNTKLADPCAVARDAAGKIYVADLIDAPTIENGLITVYGANANGNTAPLQTIAGGNTGLFNPGGIALDGAGNIYTFNTVFVDQHVLVFAPGANGNVAPIRTIAGSETGLNQPNGLAVDQAGHVYVVNLGGTGGYQASSVVIFAPGAHGNAAPIATIHGPNTGIAGAMGIAVDGAGKIYVLNTDYSSVTVYAPGSNGNVAPIATIRGSATGIFGDGGIAVDTTGTLYVTSSDASGNALTVYPGGSSGNVAPFLTLSGPATKLDQSWGVAVA